MAEYEKHKRFILRLIKVAIFPTTSQSIYGLAKMLQLGHFSRQEVVVGLERLVDIDLLAEVKKNLLSQKLTRDGVTANSILLAGTLSVLGQPLGIGQGRNPTCQAARAISLWALHDPGYLLRIIISSSRDGLIEMEFEGKNIKSNKVISFLNRTLDRELDPVSLVLVPHLDLIYEEMMKLVALRNEDGHKWVNPALYGRWVPKGFCSVFTDIAQTMISRHDDFVRKFYATHHPAYNDGHTLMYPNPVGICVTNGHAEYLGPHAVSIQRIATDPQGELRVYFFNPNNEGRQDWGQEIKPSVSGHGEYEGESSLPFHQFVSRLYAFHYNPYEEGDAFAVPEKTVLLIKNCVKKSWGKSFTWLD